MSLSPALLLILLAATPKPAPDPPGGSAPKPSDELRLPADGAAGVLLGPVRGDGRSVYPVVSPDGTPQQKLTFSCGNAATLYRGSDCQPFLLAPAVSAAQVLSCKSRSALGETDYQVSIAPPGPGLYASFSPPQVTADASPVDLQVFRIGADGRRSPPKHLRAVATNGTLAPGDEGTWHLDLSDDKAPRVVAVALLDGELTGAAFLPVAGQTRLPITSKRRVTLEVRVCGGTFGPFDAETGKALVSIEVPAGVTAAIVDATDRANNRSESPLALNPPKRPRLAAVAAADELEVGSRSRLAVALAADNGAPALPTSTIEAIASRGQVGPAEALAPGLWTIPYVAPTTPGEESVTVRLAGEPEAGSRTLDLRISTGKPAQIEVTIPEGPFRAGAAISGEIRLRDAFGNAVSGPTPTATLGRSAVAVEPTGEGFSLRAAVPSDATGGVVVPLSVRAGSATTEVQLEVKVDAEPQPQREPTSGLTVGAFALAGWTTNGSAVSSPRGVLGAGLRHDAGPLELGLLGGLELASSSSSQTATVGGRDLTVTNSLRVLAVPIALRARIELGSLLGVSFGGGVVPAWVRSRSTATSQPPEIATAWRVGWRGQLSADTAVGPGRAVLTLAGGQTRVSQGSVRGAIEHFAVFVGYEWWFWSFGA